MELNNLFTVFRLVLLQNKIPFLMLIGIMGAFLYIFGWITNRSALARIARGQVVDWPYKPLSLFFQIVGIVDLIAASVGLYFAGAYEPFFNLLR